MNNDAETSFLGGEGWWLNKNGSMTIGQGYPANAAENSHVYTFSAAKKGSSE